MYKNLINVTNRVYGQLQDDISKDIYKARVLNSITYDYNYITQIAVDGKRTIRCTLTFKRPWLAVFLFSDIFW